MTIRKRQTDAPGLTDLEGLPISDEKLLEQAQEILDLLVRAYKLDYTLTMPPEQYQVLIAILENAHLVKLQSKHNDNTKTTD